MYNSAAQQTEHMNTKSTSNTSVAYSYNVLKVVFFSILILRMLSNPMFDPPSRDSGVFMYIGSLILKGNLPYISALDNKGPLVFYINALGLLISGGSRWGIWLMELVFLFAALYLAYQVTHEYMGGEIPALVGAFIWTSAARTVLEGGNLSEEYSLLFYFLTAWTFLKSMSGESGKKFDFLIGISTGFSIFLRPNNISMHIAVVLVYLILGFLSRDWQTLLRRILFLALGGLTVVLPLLIYFAINGALSEMIRAMILFNFQYSGERNITGIFNGIRIAFETMGFAYSLPAIVGFFMAIALLFKRSAWKSGVGILILLVLIGWPIEILSSTLSGRNYYHYFILWAPYMGVLASYAVYVILNSWSGRSDRIWAYVTILMLSLVAVWEAKSVWSRYGEVMRLKLSNPQAQVDYRIPIADYLQKNTQPSDKVLVWGFRPAVYFMSAREAPAAFLPYPVIHVDTELGYRWGDQFYAQFTANPPVLIVDMVNPTVDPIPAIDEKIRRTQRKILRDAVLAPNVDQLFEYINTNYVFIDEVDGYPVYRLK